MYKIMKIYFDKITGEIIWASSHNQLTVVDFEHDCMVVNDLNTRERSSIDLLVLEDGQYSQDFAECNGYRVNVETNELEFSYPDPSEPEAPVVYDAPLTSQIKDLETQTKQTNADLSAFMDYVLGGMV